MNQAQIPGLGCINESYHGDLFDLATGGNGLWRVGIDGVRRILAPRDRKVELIIFKDKTLVYIKSALGYPAIYPLPEVSFDGPAEAVLMDLDGTTVRSEGLWIRIIESTTARLMDNPFFKLKKEDGAYISGHSVSEHLQYCINKYCPDKSLEEARRIYYEITCFQMQEALAGGEAGRFLTPSPHLKEFLVALKAHGIKIGLVTSGLYEKAWPEIVSAFNIMQMGDPLDYYDTIITGGNSLGKGRVGTLGELTPKPHPWLYAETARVGLGLEYTRRNRVIGIEDSAAGIVALRLAGFAAIGIAGGNINAGGVRSFLYAECRSLMDALPIVLGRD